MAEIDRSLEQRLTPQAGHPQLEEFLKNISDERLAEVFSLESLAHMESALIERL
jgi:hypothetical protein